MIDVGLLKIKRANFRSRLILPRNSWEAPPSLFYRKGIIACWSNDIRTHKTVVLDETKTLGEFTSLFSPELD